MHNLFIVFLKSSLLQNSRKNYCFTGNIHVPHRYQMDAYLVLQHVAVNGACRSRHLFHVDIMAKQIWFNYMTFRNVCIIFLFLFQVYFQWPWRNSSSTCHPKLNDSLSTTSATVIQVCSRALIYNAYVSVTCVHPRWFPSQSGTQWCPVVVPI